jgi:hypothetical protein
MAKAHGSIFLKGERGMRRSRMQNREELKELQI